VNANDTLQKFAVELQKDSTQDDTNNNEINKRFNTNITSDSNDLFSGMGAIMESYVDNFFDSLMQ
jgi:hypothetical protein